MDMTVEVAARINELYKQIDTLTVENKTLKESAPSDLSTKLESIDAKLDKLLTNKPSK